MPVTRIPRTLQEAISMSVSHGENKLNKTIAEMAEDTGVDKGTFYRWDQPENTTSFAPMPLRRLVKFMQATGSTAILDYLARKFGCIIVKLPTKGLTKYAEGEMVNDYSQYCNHASSAMIKFIKKPNQQNFEDVEDTLVQVMKASESARKVCEKHLTGQEALDL
jgi:hypothetical protein